MIKVLVSWERDDEIKEALEIHSKIHELLDSLDLHSGTSTTNDPPKTFGLHIKENSK